MSDQPAGHSLAYTFFRIAPAWRRLPVEERAAAKDAFAEVIEDFAPRFDYLAAYSTTGVRPESDVKSVVFFLQTGRLLGTLVIAQLAFVPFTYYIIWFTRWVAHVFG